MSKSKYRFCKQITVYLVIFSFLIFPSLSFSEEGLSELKGKIFKSDGKTSISGATVKAYHIASGKIYNSKPSDASGSYELTRLPYGYYDIAVETPDGLFVSTQAINIAPNVKLTISFSLSAFDEKPEEWWNGKEKPQIPAMQEESTGIAKILQKKGGKAFWKTGKGVATILVTSAVAIGLAAAGGGDGGTTAVTSISPQ